MIRQSRRICNCCRLAKCFRVGMQKSLILSDAEREARQDIVRQSREKRVLSTKKVRFILEHRTYIFWLIDSTNGCLTINTGSFEIFTRI